MADATPETSDASEESVSAIVQKFLQVLGRIIRLYKLYPPTHPFVKEGVEEALKTYGEAMEKAPGVTIGQVEGNLLVGNHAITKVSPQVQDLIGLLRDKKVDSVQLNPGAEPEEIFGFARLIALREGSDPPEDLTFKTFEALPHIHVNEVAYRKVSTSQEVVEKGEGSGETSDEVLLAEALLKEPSGRSVEESLIEKFVHVDPSGLGRAIHRAATQEEGVSGRGEKASGARRGGIVERILKRVASSVVQGGGTIPDVLGKFSEVLRELPAELVSRIAGGAGPKEVPGRILQGFGVPFKGEILASSLKQEPPMDRLAGEITDLLGEGEDHAPLFEGAAMALRGEGRSFHDASPYLLDLIELDRWNRKKAVEAAQESGEKKGHYAVKELPFILVADSPDYHDFFSSILEEGVYRTEFYADGTEALEAILRGEPSLVILDLKLPGIHGLDIIRRLKRKNCTPPLLIVSGQTSLAQDFEVKTYPRLKFLKKPPSPKAVSEAILELRKPERESEADEEPEEPQGLQSSLLEYLEGAGLEDTFQVRGFNIGAKVHIGPGSEAVVVDAFYLHGAKRGVLIASCTEADADAVRLLRQFQTALRIVSPWTTTGKAGLIQAAGFLGTDGITKTPIAAQTVVLDPATGKLTLCTAGAPSPLRFLSESKKVRKVGAAGVAVGRMLRGGMGHILGEERVKLTPGDLLILFSWGVMKAKNAQGDAFGLESVGGLLLTATNTSPSSIASRIGKGVERHVGEKSPGSYGVLAFRRSITS